jgi:hypothetical protein
VRRGATLLMLLLLAGPAVAQLPQVSLEVRSSGEEPVVWHVGRPIPLRFLVDLPAGYEIVDSPQPRERQEELVLRSTAVATGEARAGGGSMRQFDLELVPLQLGELTFQGISVPWTTGEGESGEAVSEPFTITVEAAIEDPMTAEPADIRGPASLPVPRRYAVAALMLAALVIALGLMWWWFRRPRPGEPSRPAPPVDPFAGLGPAAWALDALDRLVAKDILGRKGTAVYHVRLAEIVRLYLGGQFHIPTLERTTAELMLDAETSLRPLPGTRERLRHVLSACDLVKFARLEPGVEESLTLARTACELVEETRPRQPTQEPLAVEAG